MKMDELKSLSIEDLETKITALEEELFNIKFQSSITNSGKPIRVRNIRKDIARIKTLINQQKRV